MKQIIFRKRCNFKGKEYKIGSKLKLTKDNILSINKLNEKGFIESLTENELLEIYNSFFNRNKEE